MKSISVKTHKLKPLVTVIIINYNGEHFLPDCLRSLYLSDYKNIEVIMVDNGSVDSSVSIAKEILPKLITIPLKRNIGYASAHDLAYKRSKGDAVLFLNADTIIGKRTISQMVKFLFNNKNIGCVQPTIVLSDDPGKIDSVGAKFILNGDLYHIGREKSVKDARYTKPFQVFSVKNVSTLVKREVINTTGIFDTDYFAYFEETDFCMRIWMAGYEIWYLPTEPVVHKGGGGSGQLPTSYILFHAEKNRICTYLKNLSTKRAIFTLSRLLFWYQVAFLLYLFTGKIAESAAIQKAIVWNMMHFNQTLHKRNDVQNKIRAISDEDYLPNLTVDVSLKYYYYQFFGGIEKYGDI